MEIDPSQSTKHKAEALQGFAAGPLSTSLAKLSGSSRGIPSDKDFHFYRNFNEFRAPVNEIVDASQSMLGTIGSSANLWGRELGFPEDLDDAYDWLVNVNDEVFERFDVSVDEFRSLRRKEEETGVPMTSSVDFDSGFQVVYGKKKKKKDGGEVPNSLSAVKLASRDKRTMGPKAKVPFHIRSIPRPQDEFKILVNNSTQPFQHVWLQRSEDGSRSVHPQENFTALDFVDKNIGDFESLKPPPLESTPFNYVDEVKDLKELVAKLRDVDEFAVDLEHNQYRSFQGLTCLMQISTRTEDFVVDTLKLRIQIGPYLRELFKDPTKKKVMHGADRDILWLQRDFGIYICNLFDTGQASRVLKLERNSLEYLLFHFCGVTANKEYQNADWRLRPLPEEMLRYAREDTHYLLHIYDLLRIRLLSEKSDDLLVEVYKRSYDLCMQLYEKELLTESSYLHIYGLQGADLNAQQLAVVAVAEVHKRMLSDAPFDVLGIWKGLCEWRDVVARAEDESTGYILPNKTLLEIAKQMPVTTTKLLHLVKSKHPCVERNLNSVVSVIKQSMQNAVAFETAAERLKEERMERASQRNIVSTDRSEAPPEVPAGLKTTATTENQGAGMSGEPPAPSHFRGTLKLESNFAEISKNVREGALEHNGGQNASIESQTSDNASRLQGESPITSGQSKEGAIAAIHVLQKPSHAFGAMLGSSSGKRKLVSDKKEKEAMKLEQIQSSVSFPFHSFSGMDEQLQPPVEGMRHDFPPAVQGGVSNLGDVILLDFPPAVQGGVSNLGDVILLDDNACVEGTSSGEPTREQLDHNEEHIEGSDFEMAEGDEAMSLTDLSSSFQRCFQSTSQARKLKQAGTSKDPEGLLQLKPFDYEGARRQIKFGEGSRAEPKEKGDEGHADRSRVDPVDRASSAATSAGDSQSQSQSQSRRDDEGTRNLAQGRRRQAFPASGNRSATFR